MIKTNLDDLVSRDDGTLLVPENGLPFTGVAIELAPDGIGLVSEAAYVNGLQEGLARDFFPDGKVEYEANFLGGSKHGAATRFDAQGRRRVRELFERSILLESDEWDEGGQLVKSYRLPQDSAQYRTLELMRAAYARGTPPTGPRT